MRVFIAGVDGYLGWSLAVYLAVRGCEIGGMDVFYRRNEVVAGGSISAIPIEVIGVRIAELFRVTGIKLQFYKGNLTNYRILEEALNEFQPDAIVHLGEIPSAPYSMTSRWHASFVQTNNITSTLNLLYYMKSHPDIPLLKIGTMGEYGTPNVEIPEGSFEIEYRGRKDQLPFPRQAGSWYHLSKVHDSHNIAFACKIWKLCVTDVMQGVVFGTRIQDMGPDHSVLNTRFDFDAVWGTLINRFCVQSVIGEPLTVYGGGGQIRGFLPLEDSMDCLYLALQNPPKAGGEYRVFNQFAETFSVKELARLVQQVAAKNGGEPAITHIENPRIEQEAHFYKPINENLKRLGYAPKRQIRDEVWRAIQDLTPHRKRIERFKGSLIPETRWDGKHRKSKNL